MANEGKPLNVVLREQMRKDGQRFFANDNVSKYLDDDKRKQLIVEATQGFEQVLDALLIDRENDPNSHGTAKRLAKMYINELMEGRFFSPPSVTAFPNEDAHGSKPYKGMLVVRSEIRSVCSHHWQPVVGVAYIGIIPGDKVIGLSKYTRLAQHCARRGTLQEELVTHIADVIEQETGSNHVAVHIGGTHGCCENRGIMAGNSLTQTTELRGYFQHNPACKTEFFDNIKLQANCGGVYR